MGLLVDTGAATREIEAAANTFVPPVTRGLVAWHFTNDTLAKARKNYAANGAVAPQIGTPVVNPTHTRFKTRANYFDAGITETDEMSFFIVCRTEDTLAAPATQPMFFGNYLTPPVTGETGNTTFGVGLFIISPTFLEFYATHGTTLADDVRDGARLNRVGLHNQWALLFCRATLSGNELHDLTNNVIASQASTLPRYRGTNKIQLGSGFSGFDGHSDIAVFAAHSVALTNAERDLQAARIRRYCAELPTPIIV